MILAVFTLQLHLMYPISADNMIATIYTTHPLSKPAIFVAVPALPPSCSQTRSKDSPIMATISNCSLSLIISFQPTPISAENSRGHQVLGR